MIDWSMNETAIRNGHKPYDPENEWQPGLLLHIHKLVENPQFGDYIAEDQITACHGLRIFARPAKAPPLVLAQYREDGCDAKQFWELRPDSCRQVQPEWSWVEGPLFVCEHEFVTD